MGASASNTASNSGTSSTSLSETPTPTNSKTPTPTNSETPTPKDALLEGALDSKSVDNTIDASAIGGISIGAILAAALCAAIAALVLRKRRKDKKNTDNNIPLSFTENKSIQNPLLLKHVKTNKKAIFAKAEITPGERISQTGLNIQDQSNNTNINTMKTTSHGISSFYKNNLTGLKYVSPQSRSPEISGNSEKIDVITDDGEIIKPLTITRLNINSEPKNVVYTNPLLDDDSSIDNSLRKNTEIFEPGKREFVKFNAVRPFTKNADIFELNNRISQRNINPLIFDLNKEKVAFPVKKIQENID
jgi:hypothetical protein